MVTDLFLALLCALASPSPSEDKLLQVEMKSCPIPGVSAKSIMAGVYASLRKETVNTVAAYNDLNEDIKLVTQVAS